MEKPRRTSRSNGMIVNEIGELNCKLFAETFVEIFRKEVLNGEIGLKDYTKTSENKNSNDKKE
ncbi:UNVERIFIED_CONTAM: hypothetical protein ACS92_34255 [Bacillus cereus]|nr:hypothetical protein [Bacillus cereus group sp. Bc007]ONG70138.1 hypothetical protein BKK44_14050 [Bacillus cereus]